MELLLLLVVAAVGAYVAYKKVPKFKEAIDKLKAKVGL